MFRGSSMLLRKGQYLLRLKTRMVGYIPPVVPRKIKGAMVVMRSESNSGSAYGYIKDQAERLDTTGRKLQKVDYDIVAQRYCVFKEQKMKGGVLTRNSVVPPKKFQQ